MSILKTQPSDKKKNLPLEVLLVRNCTETFFLFGCVCVVASCTQGSDSVPLAVSCPLTLSSKDAVESSLSCSATIFQKNKVSLD